MICTLIGQPQQRLCPIFVGNIIHGRPQVAHCAILAIPSLSDSDKTGTLARFIVRTTLLLPPVGPLPAPVTRHPSFEPVPAPPRLFCNFMGTFFVRLSTEPLSTNLQECREGCRAP